MLMFVDVFDNVLYSLGDIDSLDACFSLQLLGDLFLVLNIADHHVHDGRIGETYFDGFLYTC